MKTEQIERVQTKSILKIGIDNDWWIEDFTVLFDSVNRLYAYYYFLEQAEEIYQNMGTEFEWNKNFKNLPQYFDISRNFKAHINDIFKDDIDNERTLFNNLFRFSNVESLKVHKIIFGSKGSVDLIGIGKIFEVIKDFVCNYVPNKETKIDMLIKQKEIEEREQKILQLKIENLKNLGLKTDEILEILGFEATHLNRLKKLKIEDRIIDFEIEKMSKQ